MSGEIERASEVEGTIIGKVQVHPESICIIDGEPVLRLRFVSDLPTELAKEAIMNAIKLKEVDFDSDLSEKVKIATSNDREWQSGIDQETRESNIANSKLN